MERGCHLGKGKTLVKFDNLSEKVKISSIIIAPEKTM